MGMYEMDVDGYPADDALRTAFGLPLRSRAPVSDMSIHEFWCAAADVRGRLAPLVEGPREPICLVTTPQLAICDDAYAQWRTDFSRCPISGRMLSAEEIEAERIISQ